ncbi:acyl carrier protein [Patescibacteria group bacterium]|nr:acyl carrier protein [Patescibacteria group bacterium]
MKNLNGQVQEDKGLIFPVVRDVLAETLTYEPEEITQDTSFDEDDLDIIGTPDHERILLQIQKKFPDVQLDMHTLRDCVTVAELVSVIEEEKEFAEV